MPEIGWRTMTSAATIAGMAGKPGMHKGSRAPMWKAALRRALHDVDPNAPKEEKHVKNIDRVALAVVRAAIAGDMQAAREIGDRMDGKPKQAIETSGELDLRVTQGQEAAAELESIIKAIASKDAETRSESVH